MVKKGPGGNLYTILNLHVSLPRLLHLISGHWAGGKLAWTGETGYLPSGLPKLGMITFPMARGAFTAAGQVVGPSHHRALDVAFASAPAIMHDSVRGPVPHYLVDSGVNT